MTTHSCRDRNNRSKPHWSGCCLLLLTIVGCTATSADDDGRLEHHAPAHKPATFPAAVEQLHTRSESLAASMSADLPEKWSELLDIVRWLPELAGDSDLRQADWEQTQRISHELEAILLPQNPTSALPSETLEQVRKLLAELEPLISRADRLNNHVSQ